MKKRMLAILLSAVLGSSLYALPASADPAPFPTATATFSMSESWFQNYWAYAEGKEIKDSLEFPVMAPDYSTKYVSVIGDKFRIRSINGSPTIYSRELNYMTEISFGRLVASTAVLTPDGEIKDINRPLGYFETYRYSYGGTFIITSLVSISGWKDALPPQSAADALLASGGWTVTLSAKDDHSGVSSIEYRLNGQTWTPYTAPFFVPAGGSPVLEYRSTDNDGNVEPIRTKKL